MIRIAHGMQANRHRGDMRKRRDNMKQHNEKNLEAEMLQRIAQQMNDIAEQIAAFALRA